jgi:NAD-specific glutamate dehydrogenase/predicted RNA-binding Zn-ribbon protein involved in translation (DUF1610 family)
MPKTHEKASEKLERAYDTMLERVQAMMETAKGGGETLQQALKEARDKAVELDELTRDEAQKVSSWVQRDLQDAGNYLSKTRHELADWFHMDMELIEYSLLDLFSKAADQTKLQLLQLEEQAKHVDEYYSGEVTAPGTLECKQCGELIHLKKSGHIPPCPRCRSTVFTRKSRAHESKPKAED